MIKKIFFIIVYLSSLFIVFTVGQIRYDYLKIEYDRLLNKPPEVIEVEKEVEIIKEYPVYLPYDKALSEKDFALLCELIFLEAGSSNTSNLDRVLVGNIALNRVLCNYRGASSLEEVIHSPDQYSTVKRITQDEETMIPLSTAIAAYRLAIGNRYCPNNVIYQSQYKQGDGVWIKVNNHYYCYDKNIPIDESILIQDFIK